MAQTHTGETSFRLAFRGEAIIPVDVGIACYMIAHHDEWKNEGVIHLHLDLLDEVRATAKQQMASTKTSGLNTITSVSNLDTSASRTLS